VGVYSRDMGRGNSREVGWGRSRLQHLPVVKVLLGAQQRRALPLAPPEQLRHHLLGRE